MIHLGFAVWIYGSPLIFGDLPGIDTDLQQFDIVQQKDVPYVFYTVYKRAIKWQTLALSIMFILLILATVFNIFFKNTLGKVCMAACPKRLKLKNQNSKYRIISKYHDLINKNDLKDENYFAQEEAKKCEYEEMKPILSNKVERVNYQLAHTINNDPATTFAGIFSYRIGHNPDYKEFLKIDGIQK